MTNTERSMAERPLHKERKLFYLEEFLHPALLRRSGVFQ